MEAIDLIDHGTANPKAIFNMIPEYMAVTGSKANELESVPVKPIISGELLLPVISYSSSSNMTRTYSSDKCT